MPLDVVAAAEPSTSPWLGLAGVLVTAVVQLVTSVRWRTPARRLQEHVLLVKDLPEGHREALLDLVDAEVAELVKVERRRLDPVDRVLVGAVQVGLAAVYLLFGSLLLLSTLDPPADSIWAELVDVATTISSYGVALLAVAPLLLVLHRNAPLPDLLAVMSGHRRRPW